MCVLSGIILLYDFFRYFTMLWRVFGHVISRFLLAVK